MKAMPVIDLQGAESDIIDVRGDGVVVFSKPIMRACFYRLTPESRAAHERRTAALEAYRLADAELEKHRVFDNTTRLAPDAYLESIGVAEVESSRAE